jgi:hypothetical protein
LRSWGNREKYLEACKLSVSGARSQFPEFTLDPPSPPPGQPWPPGIQLAPFSTAHWDTPAQLPSNKGFLYEFETAVFVMRGPLAGEFLATMVWGVHASEPTYENKKTARKSPLSPKTKVEVLRTKTNSGKLGYGFPKEEGPSQAMMHALVHWLRGAQQELSTQSKVAGGTKDAFSIDIPASLLPLDAKDDPNVALTLLPPEDSLNVPHFERALDRIKTNDKIRVWCIGMGTSRSLGAKGGRMVLRYLVGRGVPENRIRVLGVDNNSPEPMYGDYFPGYPLWVRAPEALGRWKGYVTVVIRILDMSDKKKVTGTP